MEIFVTVLLFVASALAHPDIGYNYRTPHIQSNNQPQAQQFHQNSKQQFQIQSVPQLVQYHYTQNIQGNQESMIPRELLVATQHFDPQFAPQNIPSLPQVPSNQIQPQNQPSYLPPIAPQSSNQVHSQNQPKYLPPIVPQSSSGNAQIQTYGISNNSPSPKSVSYQKDVQGSSLHVTSNFEAQSSNRNLLSQYLPPQVLNTAGIDLSANQNEPSISISSGFLNSAPSSVSQTQSPFSKENIPLQQASGASAVPNFGIPTQNSAAPLLPNNVLTNEEFAKAFNTLNSLQSKAAPLPGVSTGQQEIVKHIYLHGAPEDSNTPARQLPSKKSYNVIFIKAPVVNNQEIVHRPVEEKTIVYVLVNKPEHPQITVKEAEREPSKPEVYFIKYKAPNKNQEIQAADASQDGY